MLDTKVSKKSTIISVLILVGALLIGGFYQAGLIAQSASSPNFPSCQSLFGTEGNVASYDSGLHQIVGDGLLEGSDDVYSQSNGNYVQCYCPAVGVAGIQSNWWLADSLSQEDVNHYVSLGWIYENGDQWNLGNHMYLVRNSASICAVPTMTPSPSPTVMPTLTPTPMPSITPTPTKTPTLGSETESPRCVGLSASPTEGSAPLTVHFIGSGFDKNGPILEYEFNFGDSSGFQSQIWMQKESEAAHRYENAGTYIASLKVKDQGGVWRDGNDDCKKTIIVKSSPMVLSTSTPDVLPSAGASVLALSGLAPLGYYLYRRFKLV